EAEWGESELGLFAAMAYFPVAASIVVMALGQSACPRLAKYYAAGKRVEFLSLLLRLLAIGAVLGLTGVLVVWIAGREILALIYTPEYAGRSEVLVVLMVSAGLSAVASFLGYGMTAARRFAVQAPLFVLVALATLLASVLFVPSVGLVGAAWAM